MDFHDDLKDIVSEVVSLHTMSLYFAKILNKVSLFKVGLNNVSLFTEGLNKVRL